MMNIESLIQTIESDLQSHGFARIKASDVLEVFASDGNERHSTSPGALQAFAFRHGLGFGYPEATQSNEYVFFPIRPNAQQQRLKQDGQQGL